MNESRINAKLIIPVILLVIIFLMGGGFWAFRMLVSAPSSDASKVSLTITKGESVTQIAEELQSKGLVRNSLVFRLFVRFSGFQDKIQAGSFQLSKNLALKDLTFQLARGTTDQPITIVEGWRIEEIADYLDFHHIVSREEFLDSASNAKFDYPFLPNYSSSALSKPYHRLEGYLFPDTYELAAQSSAETIINKMLRNFQSRVDQKTQDQMSKNGLNLSDTVILASIVEREANSDKDRALVAGILTKRLKTDGWKLESDVTVQFLVGKEGNWWPKDLTQDQLNIDSPYNTRKNGGLPSTPVDNPGLSSINAVVNQQTSDYWYYLAGKDGVVHFAKTLDEHNQNIAKYLR